MAISYGTITIVDKTDLGQLSVYLTGSTIRQQTCNINTNPDTLYWVIIAGCMIIFALIAHFLYIKGLAIGTAIIGGYLIIRGASFVIGHYPDENQIIDLIKHKEWEQLKQIRNYYVYLYYLAWILISLFGILVQLKLIDTKKDKSKKNE